MTIFGNFERQTSVLKVLAIFLAGMVASAGVSQTLSQSPPFLPNANPTINYMPLLQTGRPAPSAGPNSVLWPSSVSYKRMVDFVKPYLQSNLSIGIEYTYNFSFNLSAKSQLHGADVPDGWYLLEMAVVLPDDNMSPALRAAGQPEHLSVYERYVTSRSLFVQVVGHTLTKKISLLFPNLSATTLMNHLYIELTPLQTSCSSELPSGRLGEAPCIHVTPNGEADARNSSIVPLPNYTPYLIDMPFVPYRSQDSASGDADESQQSFSGTTQDNLSTYIAKAKQLQAAHRMQVPKVTPQEYAAQHKLAYLSIHDPSLAAYAKYFLKGQRPEDALAPLLEGSGIGTLQLTEAQQNFLPIICYALATHNEQYARNYTRGSQAPDNFRLFFGYYMNKCFHQPAEVINIARRVHVKRFDGASVKPQLSQALSFNVQNNFLLSRNHSVDTLHAAGTNLQFKPLDVMGMFQATVTASYQVLVSDGRSESESQSGTLGLPIDFNMVGMSFTALDSQRCLEVLAKATPQSPLYDDRPNATHNGVYICDDESATPSQVSEIYAHVFVNHAETSLVDTFSNLSQSLNLTLEGDSDLSSFYYQLRQGMSADAAAHLGPFRLLENGRNHFLAHATEPSVVTTPIQFAHQDPQSLSALAFGTYSESFIGNQ